MAPKSGTSGELLDSARKKPKAKKKSQRQEFPVVSGQSGAVDRWTNIKFVIAALTGELKKVQTEITNATDVAYKKSADERDMKSFRVPGEIYPDGVVISYHDSFSNIKEKEKEDLMVALLDAIEHNPQDSESLKEARKKARELFEELFEVQTTATMTKDILNKAANTNFMGYALKTGVLVAETARPSRENGEPIEDYVARLEGYIDEISSHGKRLHNAVKQGCETEFAGFFEVEDTIAVRSGMDKRQFKLPESVRAFLKQKAAAANTERKTLLAARLGDALREVAQILDGEGKLTKHFTVNIDDLGIPSDEDEDE